jgi:signal transduction histidine kinase
LGNWLLDHRWWIVAFTSLIVFTYEFLEYYPFNHGLFINPFVEVFIYGIVMPVIMGLLLTGLAVRSELAWTNYFQDLSSNLAIQLQHVHTDNDLANIILQFFSVIMPLHGVVVYRLFPGTKKYIPILCRMLKKDVDLSNSEFECWGTGCPFLPSATGKEAIIQRCFNHQVAISSKSSSCYCIQFRFSNEALAGVRLYLAKDSDPTPEQVSLLKEITPIIASAFHYIQLEDSMKKHDDLIQAESKRLARDVHDSLGHSLAYLRLRLDQMSMEPNQSGLEDLYKEVESLRDVAKDAYDQMRAILVSLTPHIDSDISTTLLNFADKISQRDKFVMSTHISGKSHILAPHVERNVFFIFQEILTNVEKHAQASTVDVNINWRENDFVIEVKDDGVGFNPLMSVQDDHFGLHNMQERAQESNAQLVVTSQPNQGTCVTLNVPYENRK